MVLAATNYHRRMGGGGSDAQVIEASDGFLYVTKLIGNPQGTRILANEWAVASVGELLGVPIPPYDIVNVDDDFIQEINRIAGTNFGPGPQFGSRLIGQEEATVLPSTLDLMQTTVNLSSLATVIVLDTLVQNQDEKAAHLLVSKNDESMFWAVDHGHCLGVASGWDTLSVDNITLRKIHPELISGAQAFGQALEALADLTEESIQGVLDRAPLERWDVSSDETRRLVRYLVDAIPQVEEVINLSRPVFPNWTE